MDDSTRTQERSADEIRRDIERTRARMDGTVDAIGDHLSPGRILDELYVRFRAGDHSGLIGDGASRVGQSLGQTMKDHPLPSAVIGLGLGLLAWEQVKEHSNGHVGPGTYARAEGRVGPYRGDAVDHHDPDWEHAGTVTKVKGKVAGAASAVKGGVESVREVASDVREKASEMKERASEAGQRVRERASEAGHRVQEKASAVGQTAREKAHDVRDGAAHTGEVVAEGVSHAADAAAHRASAGARRAKEGFGRLLEENPLALGAIALGLGIAAGVSTPTTRWEDRRMGQASDTVKDEVRRVGRETMEKARRVAGEAASAATEELRVQKEQGPAEIAMRAAAQQVKASAQEVMRAAERAAREAAEEEGLTGDGLKREVEASRDRTLGRTPAGSMGDD